MSVGTNAGDDGPFYRGTQLDIICSISVDASVNTAFDLNITWTRDSENVMSGPNITISRANTSRLEFTSTLTIIRPLDNPDSAFYTCTAAVFPTDGEGVLASNDITASVNVSVDGKSVFIITPPFMISSVPQSLVHQMLQELRLCLKLANLSRPNATSQHPSIWRLLHLWSG